MHPQTTNDVIDAVGLPRDRVMRYARLADDSYRRFIDRRGRKPRTIHAPHPGLKAIQDSLKEHVLSKIVLHECSFSRAGRSVVEHAFAHASQAHMLQIDLRLAFPSVRPGQVRAALQRAGFGVAASGLVTRLATCRGVLPQGAPTSSILLEAVLVPLDEEFYRLAQARGATYSRYVDDLVLSAPVSLRSILLRAKQIIGDAGFEVNRGKLRVLGPGIAHIVAGVDVTSKPAPSADWLKRLVKVLDGAAVGGSAGDWKRISSSIAWVRQIDPELADALTQRFITPPEAEPGWLGARGGQRYKGDSRVI
jgi:hypothetical protein